MSIPATSRGNAFIYVLIAVVLFGALSFAISKGNDSNPTGEINDAAAKTAATSILAYEAQARTAVDGMIQNGTNVANIDFTMPSDASFNTAPTINKLFHPDGGGLQWKPLPATALGTIISWQNSFFIGRPGNVEWTPTTSSDIVFSAFGINEKVCKELNSKVLGSTAILTIQNTNTRYVFVPASISGHVQMDFPASWCSTCDQKAMACARYGAQIDGNIFYSILVSR